MPDHSREHLLKLCEKATVPVERWANRDTPSAQEQVGRCWVLLKAGCDFEVDAKETNGETIWLSITAPTFNTFEYGDDDDFSESQLFYLPTEERLAEREDGDWY